MDNLIEHIARYADMDTRRAMGILPRKLPPSNLNLNLNFVPQGCARKINLGGAISLTVHPSGGICWVFGALRLETITEWFFTRDGRMRFWSMYECETSLHPDFNEDRTLKSWQAV